MEKGSYVKLLSNDFCGVIEQISKNSVVIINKNKKITTNINNVIDITKEDFLNTFRDYSISKYKHSVANKPYTLTLSSEPCDEIMIRHQTELEAMSNVDKFLDTAYVNRISTVKIIHGKRGGVLRKALHEILDSHPYVEDYALGDYYTGQYGVTIVHLKNMP